MAYQDKNCLSYWFPKIEAAGLPVPRTKVIITEIMLHDLLDGKTPEGYDEFIDLLAKAGDELEAWPCFLRTGVLSVFATNVA